MLISHSFALLGSFIPNNPPYPPAQTPIPASTTLILVGALLLVLIILAGVLWVARQRK